MKNINKIKLNIFDKIAFWILIIFAIFIPFHAFLVTFLPHFFWNLWFWNFFWLWKFFLVWKEILFLVLSFLFFWKFLQNLFFNLKEDKKSKNNLIKKFFSHWKKENCIKKFFLWFKIFFYLSKKSFPIQQFFFFDKIFLAFFLIAVIPVFYRFFTWSFWENFLLQSIFWFRVDFIYFLIFYLIRWFSFDFTQIKKFFYVFIFSWLTALIFWFSLYLSSFNRVPEKIITSKKNFIEISDENKKIIKQFYFHKSWENDDILRKKEGLNENEKIILEKFFENPDLINFRNENFLNLMVDKFWYSPGVSNYEVQKALPAFHIVEAKWTARLAATFSWPNQLWFFLMVFIGVILWFLKFLFKNNWWKIEKIFLISVLIFSLICLYFSFSRSAWLWILLIFWLFAFFSFPQKYHLKIFFWWIFLLVLTIFYTYFFQQDFFERTILRWGSTAMHFERSLEWIGQVVEKPLGYWLWFAWPVSMKFPENWVKIAENWFIQMFQEFWILWWIFYLFLFFNFLVFLIRKFLSEKFDNFLIFWWFLGLCGVLLAGLFLHSFEDIWVSILLFVILSLWFQKKFWHT